MDFTSFCFFLSACLMIERRDGKITFCRDKQQAAIQVRYVFSIQEKHCQTYCNIQFLLAQKVIFIIVNSVYFSFSTDVVANPLSEDNSRLNRPTSLKIKNEVLPSKVIGRDD